MHFEQCQHYYSASSLKNKQLIFFFFKLEYFIIPVTYLFFLDSTPVSRVQQELAQQKSQNQSPYIDFQYISAILFWRHQIAVIRHKSSVIKLTRQARLPAGEFPQMHTPIG